MSNKTEDAFNFRPFLRSISRRQLIDFMVNLSPFGDINAQNERRFGKLHSLPHFSTPEAQWSLSMNALLGYEGRKLLYCTDFIYIYNQEFSNSPYAPDIPPKYKTELVSDI